MIRTQLTEKASLQTRAFHLAGKADRALFNTTDSDRWAAVATAFASLSGMLEDLPADGDPMKAVRHGIALLNAEVYSADAVMDEADSVVDEILAWGRRATVCN